VCEIHNYWTWDGHNHVWKLNNLFCNIAETVMTLTTDNNLDLVKTILPSLSVFCRLIFWSSAYSTQAAAWLARVTYVEPVYMLTARFHSLRRRQFVKPCNRSFYAWQHGTRFLKQHDLTRWDKASVDTLPPQDTSTGMAAKYTLALNSTANVDSNSCSLDLEVPR